MKRRIRSIAKKRPKRARHGRPAANPVERRCTHFAPREVPVHAACLRLATPEEAGAEGESAFHWAARTMAECLAESIEKAAGKKRAAGFLDCATAAMAEGGLYCTSDSAGCDFQDGPVADPDCPPQASMAVWNAEGVNPSVCLAWDLAWRSRPGVRVRGHFTALDPDVDGVALVSLESWAYRVDGRAPDRLIDFHDAPGPVWAARAEQALEVTGLACVPLPWFVLPDDDDPAFPPGMALSRCLADAFAGMARPAPLGEVGLAKPRIELSQAPEGGWDVDGLMQAVDRVLSDTAAAVRSPGPLSYAYRLCKIASQGDGPAAAADGDGPERLDPGLLERRLDQARAEQRAADEARFAEREDELKGQVGRARETASDEKRARLKAEEALRAAEGRLRGIEEREAHAARAEAALDDERRRHAAEVSALENKVRRLTAERDGLKAFRPAPTLVDGLCTMPVSEMASVPQSLLDVVKLAQQAYPERLLFLDSALKSAERYEGRALNRYWKCVTALATQLWPLHFCEHCGNEAEAMARIAGIEIAMRESDSVHNKPRWKQARTFSHNGKAVYMEKHVKVCGGSNEVSCRLHFEYDEEARKIVIGHFGCHLDNTAS